MIKKYLKIALCALTLCILLGTGAMVAFAGGSVQSNWYYYGPVAGYYYQNMAICLTCPVGAQAETLVEPQWGGSAPSGYMGAMAQLYNTSGQLCAYTNWGFNQGVSYSEFMTTYPAYNVHGGYYSYGESAAYNGNGYNHYWTYVSPNITY